MTQPTFKEAVLASPPALKVATDILTGVGVLAAVSDLLGALPVTGLLIGCIDLFHDMSAIHALPLPPPGSSDINAKNRYGYCLSAFADVGLIAVACGSISHVITAGSAALGWMCYAFAFKSAVDCCFAINAYNVVKKNRDSSEAEREAALRRMRVSILRTTGWLLLSAAHLAITSSVAPVLLIAGSVCLLAAGVYGAYHVYKNYKAGTGFFARNNPLPLGGDDTTDGLDYRGKMGGGLRGFSNSGI